MAPECDIPLLTAQVFLGVLVHVPRGTLGWVQDGCRMGAMTILPPLQKGKGVQIKTAYRYRRYLHPLHPALCLDGVLWGASFNLHAVVIWNYFY